MSIRIREAQPKDGPLIYQLVRELADYERLPHEVDATEQQLVEALFSPQPRLFCDIAEWNGEPAGFALWFPISRLFAAGSVFIWRTCSCGRLSAAGAWARR